MVSGANLGQIVSLIVAMVHMLRIPSKIRYLPSGNAGMSPYHKAQPPMLSFFPLATKKRQVVGQVSQRDQHVCEGALL